MARKDVLTSWDRDNRNNMQDNFIELYGVVNDLVGTITDEVYEQIIDGSKLDWKEPVDSFGDLPTEAVEGETRMTRDIGIIYRFNGDEWKEIQEIDATAINEVDSRLSSQLAETTKNVAETTQSQNTPTLLRRDKPSPTFSFIDDDCRVELYTIIFPVLQELNMKITAAVITDRIGNSGYITLEQYYEMKDSGLVEFISHSKRHPNLNELNDYELDEELKDSQKWLLKHGGSPDFIVYPFGTTSARVREFSRKYYKAGLETISTTQYEKPPLNHFKLRRVEFEQRYNELESIVDDTIVNDGWMILNSHAFYGDFTEERFRGFLNYVKSKGYEISHMSEGFNKFGNIIDLGDTTEEGRNVYRIGANGIKYGVLENSYNFIDGTGYREETPLTDYKRGFTATYLSHNLAQQYGWGVGGSYTTFKAGNYIGYQERIHIDTNMIERRYWNRNSDSWGSWLSINVNVILPHNSISSDINPIEFPVGIYHSQVGSTLQTGYPMQSRGMTTLYNQRSVNGYIYQEFIATIATPRKFLRTYTADGVWSDWVRLDNG